MTVTDTDWLAGGAPLDWLTNAPRNNHSTVYEASRVVKGGQGLLYGFSVYNSDTASGWVQVFDLGALPANGAVPAVSLAVATVANLGANWIPPRKHEVGIVIAYSSTGPTLTLGGAKLWIDAQFL